MYIYEIGYRDENKMVATQLGFRQKLSDRDLTGYIGMATRRVVNEIVEAARNEGKERRVSELNFSNLYPAVIEELKGLGFEGIEIGGEINVHSSLSLLVLNEEADQIKAKLNIHDYEILGSVERATKLIAKEIFKDPKE